VIRRALAVCVATACASVLVLPQPSVSASSEPAPFSEEIARTMVTSSPQTVGPQNGPLSWGLDRIDQRTVVSSSMSYDFSEDGGGVTAYVLDSGVNASHPEFGGRVKEGWSYRGSSTALSSYQSALAAGSPNGITACPNDGSHAVDPGTFDNPSTVDTADKGMTDNDGHGTHVAGIIGGDTTGVAKNVTIVPVRTLDSCGSGTRTMIVEALTWILNDHEAGEKAILNLSIGFDSQVVSVDNAITAIMNEGVVVIAAAGNEATSACSNTPASTLGTISVGSSTSTDTESNFSNYGLCVDIFSPGSSIKSAYPFLSGVTNTYATQSGTSMAAPFISGAVARFLQVQDVAPTNFATGPTTAWTWLRDNVTLNAITYFNNTRSPQTENRLLYVPASSVRVEQLIATSAVNSAVVSWQNAQPSTTYVARATPGNASCTAVATSSCTITGLVGGTSYVISTVASNVNGKGASSAVVTPLVPTPPAVVIPPPSTPVETTFVVASKAVTLSWSSVSSSLPVTYVVTNSQGATVCTTTTTGCVVQGLTNGTQYSFTVVAQTSAGTSAASSRIVARPGFTVLKTVVAKKSKTLLTAFVRSLSTGKKTWSESGPCSIKASRLVAPAKKSTCVVTLKVAKTKKYPAMSTRVTIAIS
jgi:subtilisin family serine protease